MDNYILRTRTLGKKYNDFYAAQNVHMNIKKGDIYGFIGKNGAGKTTIIKLITGLTKITEGEIELFGSSEKNEIIKNRNRIGTLIEGPAYYGDMTAYENMELLRLQRGIPGKEAIISKLKLVGLNPADKKKVNNYSLGMKQKLGIAMALLGDPEFLILDEPTNGLDPMGVASMRELLKKLNKDNGTTILISSHILGELSQLATCYGIINNGVLIEEISHQELNERCKKSIEIVVDNSKKACLTLEETLNISKYKVLPSNVIRIYDFLDKPNEISKAFSRVNISIYEMAIKGDDLEGYFLNLLGGDSNE